MNIEVIALTSSIYDHFKCDLDLQPGGVMALGKLPVPGHPTIWITVGQGSTVLAVGADGFVWTFLLSSILSFFFLTLFGRWPDID